MHKVILEGTFTVGIGFMAMVYGVGALTQLATVVVTVMVEYVVNTPLFMAVNEGTSPVPLPVRPIEVLEFVQEKVPPAGVLTKLVAGMMAPLHTTILAGTVTVGTGLVVIVYDPVA